MSSKTRPSTALAPAFVALVGAAFLALPVAAFAQRSEAREYRAGEPEPDPAAVSKRLLETEPEDRLADWETDLSVAVERARLSESGKRILIYFTRPATPPCAAMRRETLPDETVRRGLSGVERVVLNVDENAKLAGDFEIAELPTFVVLDSDAEEIDRFTGFLPPEVFLETFRAAADPDLAPAKLEARVAEDAEDLYALWELAKKYARDKRRVELDDAIQMIRDADPHGSKGYRDNAAYLELMTTLDVDAPRDGLQAAENFLKEFPDSEFASEILLTRAHLAYQNEQKELSLATFEEFLRKYPDAELAPQVRRDIATIRRDIAEDPSE